MKVRYRPDEIDVRLESRGYGEIEENKSQRKEIKKLSPISSNQTALKKEKNEQG